MFNISVVLATYNGSHYIEAQIRSILKQIGYNDEIIISDDNSSDDTLSIIRELQDDRICVITSSISRGPIGNFEIGLRHARGDIIVLSDQDDIWCDDRIDLIRNYFAQSQSLYDLLVLDSVIVDKSLNIMHPSVFSLLGAGKGIVKNVYRNTYIGCHMSFKRSLLNYAVPFPRLIPMHDVWLGLVSECLGTVTFCDIPTMLFRRTGQNYTKSHYSWSKRVFWRISLVYYLIRFCLFQKHRSRLTEGP